MQPAVLGNGILNVGMIVEIITLITPAMIVQIVPVQINVNI